MIDVTSKTSLKIFDDIDSNLNKLNVRMDLLYSEMVDIKRLQNAQLHNSVSMPSHYRLTFDAVLKLGNATATDVSRITGRARAIECTYLLNLHAFGFVDRKKDSKSIVYSVHPHE